jgi:hypothetical protein
MKRKNVSGFGPAKREQKLPLKTSDSLVLSSKERTKEKPNPARTWAAFDYTLPGTDSRGSIRIADISGKLIQTIDIRGKQGQYVWDTRFVKTGVYLYTIQVEGLSKTGKIVISK